MFSDLQPPKEPLVFMSWNVNGIGPRLTKDANGVLRMIEQYKPVWFLHSVVTVSRELGLELKQKNKLFMPFSAFSWPNRVSV